MTFRIISRLDIKPPNLVKGVHLEGFRKVGDPAFFARKYYEQGADEISYQDIVASLYDRNSIQSLVSITAEDVFIPVTVGGGIRNIEDATLLIRSGADKVCLNTAAVKNPDVISHLASVFGTQAVVLGIEAKHSGGGDYSVMTDCGREKSGLSVKDWAGLASELGAGEIFLTSIDREGTRSGLDLELLKLVRSLSELPIVLHGGSKTAEDISLAAKAGADGVAIASLLHFQINTITELKESLSNLGIKVRI